MPVYTSIGRTQSEVNRLALGQSYAERREVSAGLPVSLIIETTSVCNLKCVMCPYPTMGRKNRHMSFSLYEKIIREAAGSVEFIWLHLFGEPLLNPDIYKMIDIAGDAGIRTGLSTNVTKMDEKASAALLDSKLSILILCLDGATKETFEQIRVGANFEIVSANIERFAAMKRQRQSALQATLQMIDMNQNVSEQALFVQLWRDRGLDSVIVKGYHVWAGQNEQLIQLGKEQKAPPSGACCEPWVGFTVLADGGVVPCCNDYSGRMRLGDLNAQSIREIWNGPEFVRLRRRFTGDAADVIGTICERCPFPTATHTQATNGDGPFNPATENSSIYVNRSQDQA